MVFIKKHHVTNAAICGGYWESHNNHNLTRIGYLCSEARTSTQAWAVYTHCEA